MLVVKDIAVVTDIRVGKQLISVILIYVHSIFNLKEKDLFQIVHDFFFINISRLFY